MANSFQVLLKTTECFWKRTLPVICKNPVRHYWKIKNFSYLSSHSKNFWSKLTNKIENRCKFWRTRSTPRTKPWLVRKPTMASNRIFVLCFTWLREMICPNWKIESIVFGVERFHENLYGRKFTNINDHQPLKLIFSRSKVTCPPRIQNFSLWLQKYDFELEYAPGKTMLVSDALSQSYLNNIEPEFNENSLIRHVHYFILLNLPISQSWLDQFRLETWKDQILQTLICYTVNGWPEKHQVPKELFPYYSHHSEITYHEGILLKNQRIIMSPFLCSKMKLIIHQGHFGLEN